MGISINSIPADHVIVVKFSAPECMEVREAFANAMRPLGRPAIIVPHDAVVESVQLDSVVAAHIYELRQRIKQLEESVALERADRIDAGHGRSERD